VCQEFDVGHSKHISSVIRTLGAVFTSSFDGTVKILEPTRYPAVISSVCPGDGEVSRVSGRSTVKIRRTVVQLRQCDNYNRKLVQTVQQHVSYMNLSGYDVGHVTIFS